MGIYAIKPIIQIAAWLVASILVYLNLRLIIGEAIDFFETSHSFFHKSLIIAGGAILATLLLYTILHPMISKKSKVKSEKLDVEEI